MSYDPALSKGGAGIEALVDSYGSFVIDPELGWQMRKIHVYWPPKSPPRAGADATLMGTIVVLTPLKSI